VAFILARGTASGGGGVDTELLAHLKEDDDGVEMGWALLGCASGGREGRIGLAFGPGEGELPFFL
jgi:hypothetical protein